jgi:hypothetical protein
MKKLLIPVICVITVVGCKKKLETVYQPEHSNDPDPYRGTCKVNGVVQNFDSARAQYYTSGNTIYITFYRNGLTAMSFNLNNYNWNNFPSYQQFPKGVGTYTYQNGSSSVGAYNGSFVDMSTDNVFSVMLQNGSVTISQNDSVNHKMSGTFSNMTGTSFSNYLFTNGEFKQIRLTYF